MTEPREIWISLPFATFGIITRDGKIIDAAPIAKWTIGRDEQEITDYFRSRGATLGPVPLP